MFLRSYRRKKNGKVHRYWSVVEKVLSILRPGDHVIASENIYGGTFRIFESIYKPRNIEFSYVDGTNPEAFAMAIRPNTKLAWIETPANPLLQLVDIRAVAEICKSRKVILVADNTFSSPYFQRPLTLGADVVVHSTTKYVSGHSDVIGGAVITSDPKLREQFYFYQNAVGAIAGPFDCWLSLRGLKTLAVRMKQHEKNARHIAEFLSKHPAVKKVFYPGLPGHPQHELARSQMDGFGAIVSCEPFRVIIEAKVQQQLTAQRIWQDLKLEHGFTGSYYSVRRFVRHLEAVQELPFRRMECQPGDEVQVDFGQGAPVRQPNGKTKRPHVFRMTLSFSRKAYSEAVWRQDTETFLRCLENAFHAFGGVPRTVVLDNLKAAVIHPDWYDPELNPKLTSFCEHYGTVILPNRPYTPRHKGKVERQVGYVQSNGLKGKRFENLAAKNTYLVWWEANVADTRIHGTTRQQVKKLFEQQERPALLPLPSSFFPFFQEGERSVHRDGHVEVEKAYYSVPPEYTGLKVQVRYDSKLIRIFNRNMKHPSWICFLRS